MESAAVITIVVVAGVVVVLAMGALAVALYLTIRTLPQSAYAESENMARNWLAVWERGFSTGQINAPPDEPVHETLKLSEKQQPQPPDTVGQFNEVPEELEVANF